MGRLAETLSASRTDVQTDEANNQVSLALADAIYQPFPVDVLPERMKAYILAVSRATNTDASVTALPALSVAGSAIGGTRRVGVKDGYAEPPHLWCAVILPSGGGKSAPARMATAPLGELDAEYADEHADDLREHAEKLARYKRALREWELGRCAGSMPVEPCVPVARRCMIQQTTIESLRAPLSRDARGLLVYRDELAGLFASFDAYRNGRGGDAEALIELWRGDGVTVDRRDGCVRLKGGMGIVGTMTPTALAGLDRAMWTSGMMARWIIARPPELVGHENRRGVPESVREDWRSLVRELAAIDFDLEGRARVLPLTDGAWESWSAFSDELRDRRWLADDEGVKATLGKVRANVARLALVMELIENPRSHEVGAHAMQRAVAIGRWSAREAERSMALGRADQESADLAAVVGVVQANGGELTARDLRRYSWPHRTGKRDADADLEALARLKIGTFDWPKPGDKGGHPSRVFRLDIDPAHQRYPHSEAATRGSDEERETSGRRNGEDRR
jgi:hypothetical protein